MAMLPEYFACTVDDFVDKILCHSSNFFTTFRAEKLLSESQGSGKGWWPMDDTNGRKGVVFAARSPWNSTSNLSKARHRRPPLRREPSSMTNNSCKIVKDFFTFNKRIDQKTGQCHGGESSRSVERLQILLEQLKRNIEHYLYDLQC
ncbi:hypothetical protein Lal_00017782 [Lupinus albus]|nr:hypothetical protein Lal_00017782 [Lupinus albus]